MAYKLIWSPASRDDLRDIVTFISRDSPSRSEAFGYRLIAEADKLQNFCELGRVVPEYVFPQFVKSSSVPTGLFTGLTMNENLLRLRAFGMPLGARSNCEDLG